MRLPYAVPLLVALTLAASTLAACASGSETPAAMPRDFAVRYEWGNGALPPPYHYEYTVHLGPGAGTGRVEFRPVWTETFPVTDAQLRSLYATLREEGVFDREWPEGEPIAGGQVQWLEATAAGKRVTLPSQPREADRAALGRVYAAVEGVVPDGVLRGLAERQEQHQRRHEPAADTLSPGPVP